MSLQSNRCGLFCARASGRLAGATILALLLGWTAPITWAGPATTTLSPGTAQWSEPTNVPTVKINNDGTLNTEFQEKHQQFLKRGRQGDIDLLFLGDSITADWTWGHHPQLFEQYFGKYHTANFGIGGDRTEHVLWRVEHGELDGIHPRVIVLLIGTNNIGWPAADITRGITAIVNAIHQKLPDTHVLLMGVFQRGADPKSAQVIAMRDKIRQVNAALSKLDDGDKTRFVDIGDRFLSPDGTIARDVMPDALHPETKGLQIWAEAIAPPIERMMKTG